MVMLMLNVTIPNGVFPSSLRNISQNDFGSLTHLHVPTE